MMLFPFSNTELTLALLKAPPVPGAVGRLNLFAARRLTTTQTMIEVQGQRLALVPDLPRGAPPTPNVEDRRFMIPFRIPHFPIRDTLYADAVQDVRAFGETSAAPGFNGAVQERIDSMGVKLDVTLEHLRLGAVKGTVITAVDRESGAPLRSLDLFSHFNVARQPTAEWPIVGAGEVGQENTAWSAQLTGLINTLTRAMADELPGGSIAEVHAFCGARFFDAVTQHPERRAVFIALESAPLTRPLAGTQAWFRGVTFEEYRGRVGNVPFVEDDMAYFVPVGVPDLFLEIYAPADYVEAVNTLALPRYLKRELMPFDKGVQLEAQMNVLPICSVPRVLFRARATQYAPVGFEVVQAAE
jgi:Phage major capsid protein E